MMYSIGLTVPMIYCHQNMQSVNFQVILARLLFMLEVDMSIPVLFSGVYFEHLFLLIEGKK